MKAFAATFLCVNAVAVADPAAGSFEWQPLEADRLDELRGGFDSGELRASFGIERATYVNGELAVRISVQIPDVGAITPEQAAALDQAINSIVLIQNGPNNSFDASAVAAGTTVIQNTLNDQHIVTLTTMSADVNTLAHFQSLNVNESLQQALNRGVGMR
jgi:hypothetical protein